VADGFSCREQIQQTTDRRALHLAEVVRMATLHGPEGPAGDYPERAYLPGPGEVYVMPAAKAAALAAAPAGAALLWAAGRRLAAERRRARRGRWLPAAGVAAAALAAAGLLGRIARVRGGERRRGA
jgi:hypothetical protein